MFAPPTVDEDARIALLKALQLFDSPPEDVFDRITRLASRLLDVPIALISLIDRDRQWFKSRVGIDVEQTPRSLAFCSHTILDSRPLVICDATEDVRFADNPLVLEAPHIRFYTGVPIFSIAGIALGTLCVADHKPRQLSAEQLQSLQDLAELTQREIAHREASLLSHQVFDDSEAHFQSTFEQAAVGIAIVDLDGHWGWVNRKLCEIVGYSPQELQRMTFQDITHPDDRQGDLALVRQMLSGELGHNNREKRYIRKDRQPVWVNLSLSVLRGGDGRPRHFITIVTDIHARKVAEASLHALRAELEDRVAERTRQLSASEAQLRAVLENAQDAFIGIGAHGVISLWNRQAEQTFGWSRDEILGRPLQETIIPKRYKRVFGKYLRELLSTGTGPMLEQRLELMACRRNGSLFPVEVRISPLPSENGRQFCGFLHDISARKKLESSLARAATQDPLTGLPNRRALIEQIGGALNRAARSTLPLGVLFLDLDGFKLINDRYGHEAGDSLLQQFAQRLRHCVRKSDTVARLAGDEFVILLEDLKNYKGDTQGLGASIIEAMRTPFDLDGAQHVISTSIGIYVHRPDRDVTPEQLIAAADEAMYKAKRGGKSRIYLANAN